MEVNLTKANITNVATGEVLEVLFNPSEYVLSKQVIYSERTAVGKSTSYVQFSSGRRRQLRVELFFDTTDSGEDVSKYTDTLQSFMEVSSAGDGGPSNPVLLFAWGSLNFKCVLEDLKLQFTKFGPDGTPYRVIARTVFSEYVKLGDDTEAASDSPAASPAGALSSTPKL